MTRRLRNNALLTLASITIAVTASQPAQALPEMGFCPLGGPPGWWNRMVNDRHYIPVHPLYRLQTLQPYVPGQPTGFRYPTVFQPPYRPQYPPQYPVPR